MPDSQSWTWVRDLDTGHCYDVPTVRLEQAGGSLPGMQKVGGRPVHVGPHPRRTKHHTDLAGRPTAGRSRKPSTPQTTGAPASGDDAAAGTAGSADDS